jgi:hypothetical protein
LLTLERNCFTVILSQIVPESTVRDKNILIENCDLQTQYTLSSEIPHSGDYEGLYIFWDITPSIMMKINRHFGGIYRLHLQGRSVSQTRNNHRSGSKHSYILQRR